METPSCPINLPDFFAPEQFLHTTSFAEAVEAAESTFRFTRRETPVAQLSLDEELMLDVGGSAYRLTEKAFSDLCTIVRVPLNFTRDIPPDLASIIVERLKAFHQQTVVVADRDGVVVGVVDPQKWTHSQAKTHRPHYQPVPYRQLLHLTQKIWSNAGGEQRVTFADSGILIEMPGPLAEVEPRPGDITRIGMAVTGSKTGGPMPHVRGYTLRLVCTNGAVLPTTFCHVGFNTDWRVSFGRRLEVFGAAMETLAVDVVGMQQQLRETYTRLVNEPLSDVQFYSFYRQARYIHRFRPQSNEAADHTLGVSRDRRRDLIGRLRERQRELRSLSGLGGALPPQRTDLLAVDVFNSITERARDEAVFPRRVALEGLAGDVLRAFVPPSMN